MKFAGISGLRGLAMITIIAYHLNQIRPIQNLALWDWKLYQFVSLLPVVVSIFFILSGLLRSLSYWKVIFEDGEIPPFWKGVKDRFFRIAPLFYLALFVSFLWSLSQGVADWKSFFVGFTFFSWVHPSTFFPVPQNGPLWFVVYDMMGNLTVMLFMMILISSIRRVPLRKFWIIVAYFLIGFTILLGLHEVFIYLPFPKLEGIVSVWFPYYNPFIFGVYYLFGALLGGLVLSLGRRKIMPHGVFDILFLISMCSIGYILSFLRGAGDLAYSFPVSPFRFPLIPFLFGVGIFFLLFSKYLSKWMDNRLFLYIGKISYPLYLFHALVLVMIQKFFFSAGFHSFYEWCLFSSMTIIVSILLSSLLLRLEEYFHKKYLTK
ncbi:acyltransferase [Candidatus Gracilibacteria bacterium]|nr:acyltransferase [Candidatus Gracilibacteria bacterium]